MQTQMCCGVSVAVGKTKRPMTRVRCCCSLDRVHPGIVRTSISTSKVFLFTYTLRQSHTKTKYKKGDYLLTVFGGDSWEMGELPLRPPDAGADAGADEIGAVEFGMLSTGVLAPIGNGAVRDGVALEAADAAGA